MRIFWQPLFELLIGKALLMRELPLKWVTHLQNWSRCCGLSSTIWCSKTSDNFVTWVWLKERPCRRCRRLEHAKAWEPVWACAIFSLRTLLDSLAVEQGWQIQHLMTWRKLFGCGKTPLEVTSFAHGMEDQDVLWLIGSLVLIGVNRLILCLGLGDTLQDSCVVHWRCFGWTADPFETAIPFSFTCAFLPTISTASLWMVQLREAIILRTPSRQIWPELVRWWLF